MSKDSFKNKSTLEKLFVTIPIVSAFVIVALFVLMMFGFLPVNRIVIDILLLLTVACFGCLSSLTTTKILAKDKKNIWALIILGLTALTCLLWIIFIFVSQAFLDSLISSSSSSGSIVGVWTYAKIVIFVTIQTILANIILSTSNVFKKEYFWFQIVMYVSNAIVDIWLSILFLSMVVVDGEIVLKATWLVTEKLSWVVIILFGSFSALANVIFQNVLKRKTRTLVSNENVIISQDTAQENTIEARLKKLEELKEKNIITQEEYDQKKSKILDEI